MWSSLGVLPKAAVRMLAKAHPDSLSDFMNGEVREMLGIIPEGISWGGQAAQVFATLAEDFMTDAISVFDDVLASGMVSLPPKP